MATYPIRLQDNNGNTLIPLTNSYLVQHDGEHLDKVINDLSYDLTYSTYVKSLTEYDASYAIEVGDTHDEALSKLVKIIDENEIVTASGLSDHELRIRDLEDRPEANGNVEYYLTLKVRNSDIKSTHSDDYNVDVPYRDTTYLFVTAHGVYDNSKRSDPTKKVWDDLFTTQEDGTIYRLGIMIKQKVHDIFRWRLYNLPQCWLEGADPFVKSNTHTQHMFSPLVHGDLDDFGKLELDPNFTGGETRQILSCYDLIFYQCSDAAEWSPYGGSVDKWEPNYEGKLPIEYFNDPNNFDIDIAADTTFPSNYMKWYFGAQKIIPRITYQVDANGNSSWIDRNLKIEFGLGLFRMPATASMPDGFKMEYLVSNIAKFYLVRHPIVTSRLGVIRKAWEFSI